MKRSISALAVVALLTVGAIWYWRGAATTSTPAVTMVGDASSGDVTKVPVAAAPLERVTPRNLTYPEVKVVADRLGGDVKALVAFVANEIGCDAYRGALRGARGTLLAESANAVDKAILLRDLVRLSASPPEVRFAFGTLSEADAARPCIGKALPATKDTGALTGLPDDRRAIVERVAAGWARVVGEVERDAAFVASTLNAHVPSISSPNAIAPVAAVLRDHVWLQYRSGSEWIDLDASVAGATPGMRRTEAQHVAPELPEDAYHHLSIGVRVEERSGAKLATRWALRSTFRTADVSGSTISYGHAEPLGLAAPAVARKSTVIYTPVLIVDDEQHVGEPIELPAVPSGGLAGGLGGGIEGLGGRLGGMMGRVAGTPAAAGADESRSTTGVWIQILTRAPGGQERSEERSILDRIGYAARAKGEAGTARLEPIPVTFGHYMPFTTVWNVGVWLGERTVAAPLLNVAGMRGAFPALERLGAFHRSFYSLRQALFSVLSHSGSSVAHSPNISLIEWEFQRPGSADGRLTIDVLDADVSLQSPGATAVPLGVLWGHASLGAERLLFLGGTLVAGDRPPDDGASDLPNVSRVFARAQADGVRIRVLTPPDGIGVDALGATLEARARLRARLDRGFVAIVPERSVAIGNTQAIGWWLVDPRTGLLLDEMENGRRQAGTEKPGVEGGESKPQTEAAKEGFLQRFGNKIRCLGVAAQILMGAARIRAGDIAEGIQDIMDGIEGLAPNCAEGEGGVPGPPAGAGGTGPDPPPLPRVKKPPALAPDGV